MFQRGLRAVREPSLYMVYIEGMLRVLKVLRCSLKSLPIHFSLPAMCILVGISLVAVAQAERPPQAAIDHNNLGVAYMNEEFQAKALAEFQAAAQADPHSATAIANAGITLLYLRRTAEAIQALNKALELEPDDAAAWYSLGITLYSDAQTAQALDAFRHAETLAPHDADTHYFMGTMRSALGQFGPASAEFEKALQFNPRHASAEFGLARALKNLGKTAAAREHLEKFSAMTKAANGTLISSSYGEQGRLALTRDIMLPTSAASAMIQVSFTAVAQARGFDQPLEASGSVCVFALSGKRYLLLPSTRTGLTVYRIGGDAQLQPVAQQDLGLDIHGDGVACAVGDYDNDGNADVALALSDKVLLLRGEKGGRLEDMTAKSGLHIDGSELGGRPGALIFVDFDHDGDLDLLVTGAGGNHLWRNNGNGTFTEWTGPTGLGGNGATQTAVLSDVNNDRAVDLIVAGDRSAPSIYLNQREGAFRGKPLWTGAGLSSARGLAVADFNKDGWMDLLATHTGAPGLSLWRNNAGVGFVEVPLPLHGLTAAWAAVPIDFDNDGWIDMAALVETAHGTELKVLRNLGIDKFEDVTLRLGLEKLNVRGARGLIAGDFTGHAAPDLLVTYTDRPPQILRNLGGERHHALRINLTGLADNKSAIGTKVEVFSGSSWQKFEVTGAEGYMSQGSDEILAGLGEAKEVQVLRLLWPTGVPQDEVLLSASKPVDLTELDRRGGSCPVLFAWDGSKYRFVSDLIGAGVVGHWISPTQRNQSNPDEWTKIDGDSLKSYEGKLSVRFGEPMEEVNYIDQLRMIAVDHPVSTEVYPDERFLDEPPFASGKPVLVSASAHAPPAAWDDHGQDALPSLAKIDHHYLRDFKNLSYAGFANEHTLTLDLGPWNGAAPLHLVMSGYVEYFSASSMYSAWQAGIAPRSPSLEAQAPDGTWTEVMADMGFPAGLPRTMIVDLTGKLKQGTRRIRLRTNLQIYWDQILIDNASAAATGIRTTELPLATAHLEFLGYPKQIEGATPGELTYDYQSISATGPFAWQRGAYTRYGNVTPLLLARDNQFVVFGSGEDVDAEFDPTSLPPLPPGWKRDYFFYANGYVKDMDFYDASPFTVGQLPFHGMHGYPYPDGQHFPESPDSVAYQLEWNNRMETGRRTQRLAFDYRHVRSTPILDDTSGYAAKGGTE